MDRWSDEQLDAMREVGDPPADEAIEAEFHGATTTEIRPALRYLVKTDGLPGNDRGGPVEDFLRASWELPPGTDLDQVERAQRFFARWGPQIALCLFDASLTWAYACGNGVQVLGRTGRLESDTKRRIVETGQFLMWVMEPGSFEGERPRALVSIQKVRLMHAAIRHLIRHSHEVDEREPIAWDTRWGTPINQEDLLGTLMSFAYIPFDPLPKLGVRVDADDREDYLHCWNVIGELMGVELELLPRDVAEAEHVVAVIKQRQVRPTMEGRELTTALLDQLDRLTPSRHFDDIHPALMRLFMDEKTADALGVPRRSLKARAAVRLMQGTLWVSSRWVESSPLLERKLEFVSHRLLNGLLDWHREEKRMDFEIPRRLREDWHLEQAR